MLLTDGFYLDIKGINIAHEFTLNSIHGCEYPRGRGWYGLVYVLGGKADYRFFTGDKLSAERGDVLFLSPDCAYSIATEKEFRHYTVNFDIHESSSRFDALNQPYCILHEENTAQLAQIFKELIDVWRLKRSGYEMRAVGYLYKLLSLFYFEYTADRNPAPYQRLLPAKEHIEQHYDEPVTLEQLAFLSDMSITNFRREWKKHYSESPIQYRDSIRLFYAKEYLNSGYYTITEVAKRCGFDDASYFVRFFKHRTGVTPGEFKRRFLGK